MAALDRFYCTCMHPVAFRMAGTPCIEFDHLEYSTLTHCPLGNFSCFFVICGLFSKSTFSKNSFKNAIRVSNRLDPDKAQCLFGPDLCPSCLQKFSADNTRVKR